MEEKKYDDDVDATVILNLEKQISGRYIFLAQALHDYPALERECLLTSFSMNPTKESFQLLCLVGDRQLPAASTTDAGQCESIDALHAITGADVLLKSKNYDAAKAPNRLLDSLTMLSESVRADLATLLDVPRIKSLTWLIPWPELRKSCSELLQDEKKKEIVEKTTAMANGKLKFINLNYDEYKDFTPHEYPGIEKGYEVYVANSSSSEMDDRDSDATDTAPESREYIEQRRKERKRDKDRKRRLIKKSKKILEQDDSTAKNATNTPNDAGANEKKRRINKRNNTDDVQKPKRQRKQRSDTKTINQNNGTQQQQQLQNPPTDSIENIENKTINQEPVDSDAVHSTNIDRECINSNRMLDAIADNKINTDSNSSYIVNSKISNADNSQKLMQISSSDSLQHSINVNARNVDEIDSLPEFRSDVAAITTINNTQSIATGLSENYNIGADPMQVDAIAVNRDVSNTVLYQNQMIKQADSLIELNNSVEPTDTDIEGGTKINTIELLIGVAIHAQPAPKPVTDFIPVENVENDQTQRIDEIETRTKNDDQPFHKAENSTAISDEQVNAVDEKFIGCDSTNFLSQAIEVLDDRSYEDESQLFAQIMANQSSIVDNIVSSSSFPMEYCAGNISSVEEAVPSLLLVNNPMSSTIFPTEHSISTAIQIDASSVGVPGNATTNIPLALQSGTHPSKPSEAQKPKSKNPLLTFRKPRKSVTDPVGGVSDLPPLPSSPSFTFNKTQPYNSNQTYLDNSSIDSFKSDETVPDEKCDSVSSISMHHINDGENTHMSIGEHSNGPKIITKHCTVRLKRIDSDPELLNRFGHGGQSNSISIDTKSNSHTSGVAVTDFEKNNCDDFYSTNEMSSEQESPQQHTTKQANDFLDETMQPIVLLKNLNDTQLGKYTNNLNEPLIRRAEAGSEMKNVLTMHNGNVDQSYAQKNHKNRKGAAQLDSDRQQKSANGEATVTGDEDEEEDEEQQRKSYQFYTYSSVSSNQNGHNNDDDDDCNNGRSQEEQKSNCVRECNGFDAGEQCNGEQCNGQQQEQRQHNNSRQKSQRNETKQHYRDAADAVNENDEVICGKIAIHKPPAKTKYSVSNRFSLCVDEQYLL